jgi:hypothetical protein
LKNTLFAKKDKAICQWPVVSSQQSAVSSQQEVFSLATGSQAFFSLATDHWQLTTGN